MQTTRIGTEQAIILAALVLAATAACAAENPKPAVIDASTFANLQAAFDALPASGGLVRLPPGTVEIAEPLVLARPDTRIEGAGTATHIVNTNTDGQPALVVRPPGYTDKARGKRLWRVQLANFRISGSDSSGDGVLAQGVNEIFIHGLAVDHNGGNGISLVDCYEDPRVSNSIITYNKAAGLAILRGHDIVVCGNQFEENQDALRCIDSFNLCMTGNNLDDHTRHGVVIENTYGSVLSGNMIEECRGTAVVIDRDCYGITVSANVIAHEGGGGVDLVDAWGCAVSANTFTIVKQFGVRVGPKAGRIAVTGNSFSNAHIGGGRKRDDAATGVVLRGTQDIAVTGNVFSGLADAAVIAHDECRRILIEGNVMTDLSRAEPGKRPAMILGSSDVVEQGNIVAPDSRDDD
jgi:hypothetical protein